MGIVPETARNLIARQVEHHGFVLWYDPDRHYAALGHCTHSLPNSPP